MVSHCLLLSMACILEEKKSLFSLKPLDLSHTLSLTPGLLLYFVFRIIYRVPVDNFWPVNVALLKVVSCVDECNFWTQDLDLYLY